MRAVRRSLIVTALLTLAFVAVPPSLLAARGKPCARLCRQDVRSCKKSCQGTRKEKRTCKRTCQPALKAVCGTFASPSCTPAAGQCGPVPVTCALLQLLLNIEPGVGDGLPADFPPPPAGAETCGRYVYSGSQGSATFIIYTIASSLDAIGAYYTAGFEASGYEVEARQPNDPSRVGCDFGFTASRDGQVDGVVVYSPEQGMLVVANGTGGGVPSRPPVKR